MLHIFDPSAVQAKAEGSLEFTSQSAQPSSEFWGQGETLLQKHSGEWQRKTPTWASGLHTLEHKHACTHGYHTYTVINYKTASWQ